MSSEPLVDLMLARGRDVGEFGVGLVPMTYHEPDPQTFRHDFYYNTRENVLYKRTHTDDPNPFWKRASFPAPAPKPRPIPPMPVTP